jgi:hypothetical protein
MRLDLAHVGKIWSTAMNKPLRIMVAVAVGFAAFYGVKSLRQPSANPEQTAEAISRQMDDLRERAKREHPDLPPTDALKAVTAAESARKLAAQSGDQRANTAADMFWGFYWINTKARVEYCAERGVDLAPFASAFQKHHDAELQRAKSIYSAAGIDPQSALRTVQPELTKVVVQDMKDVAAGAKVPLEQTCALFNANAEQFAQLIELSPEVKQALMAQ